MPCTCSAGSLGVFGAALSGGRGRLLGVIAPGETVGELGLLTDQTRIRNVRALRDCTLLQLPRASFERLLSSHPEGCCLSMARSLRARWPRIWRERCAARHDRAADRADPRRAHHAPAAQGVWQPRHRESGATVLLRVLQPQPPQRRCAYARTTVAVAARQHGDPRRAAACCTRAWCTSMARR